MAAIYGFKDKVIITLSTTLYPVEVAEAVVFGVSIVSGSMHEIQNDYFTHGPHSVFDGSYTQLRWFFTDGPYYDAFTHGPHTALDGTYVQLRWFLVDGPYYDYFTHGPHTVLDGTLINKLVSADSPDEELQLNMTIIATSTMDLI